MAYEKRKHPCLEIDDSKVLAVRDDASASHRLDLTMSNYIALLKELAPTDPFHKQENGVASAPLTLSRWVRK